MKRLAHDNVLIIPDVHQDIVWAESILEKHKKDVDHIIWLGDWFDTFEEKKRFGSKATVEWLVDRIKNTDDTFLLGNHDLAYMEARLMGLTFPKKYNCSGVTKSKVGKISKEMSHTDWYRFEPFLILNDKRIISHAGIVEKLLPIVPNPREGEITESLEILYKEAKEYMTDRMYDFTNIFSAGSARGGQGVGGIVWSDFNFEHTPISDTKYNQIVGHTGYTNTVRNIGNDWCIDGNQSTYAIVVDRDNIEFKSTQNEPQFETIEIK